MNRKRFMKRFACLFFLLLALHTAAQEKAYFQQRVAYNIQVSLDDVNHELAGFETLEYENNSPDVLPFIWMHLWPNAYRQNGTALEKQLTASGETALHYEADTSSLSNDRGWIDRLDFQVDGRTAKTEPHPQHIDIIKLVLNEPLKPGGKITITTPFRVRIPGGQFSRLGHIRQQYQITQWYPKPAVYDRNGWNEMPYLDQGEFYSEFGTYDVYIKVPKNYVVGATGDLQNAEERRWLDSLAALKGLRFEPKEPAPASSSETKTLHFHQENVHDFAWFCDKTYNVRKSEVELPHSGRKVTTWAMYTSKFDALWKNATEYINDAVYYYSLWNGDYPYNHCTAVDGALSAGGGMEYPNITVIGGVESTYTLEVVIMHEVGHNWFYGILGSNEREHPWMDEGLNSYNELRYQETKYPNKALLGDTAGPNRGAKILGVERYKQKAQYYQLYAFSCRQHLDQPIELPAEEYTSINYAGIVYYKSALAFDYMRGYLGDALMDQCMQAYFERWKFKHPQPADLRNVFEEVTGKNLSWFFDDLIGTTKKLDYKIGAAKKLPDGSWEVKVKNTGAIKGPVPLCGVKDGKMRGVVWYEGFEGKQTLSFPAADVDHFVIDCHEDVPEYNRKNNRSYTRGLLRRAEPFKLQWLASLDDPTHTQLFWTPVAGWNYYNGFMAGVALYNHAVPQKRFEWMLMPMFGFRNGNVAGHADAFFHFNPRKIFQQIDLGANFNRYCYLNEPLIDQNFNKLAPELNLQIKKKRLRSPLSQNIRIRNIILYNEGVTGNYLFTPPIYDYTTSTRSFYELSYTLRNARKIHPFGFTAVLQQGDGMVKTTFTGDGRLNVNEKKGIDWRVFAGTFIDNDNTGGDYRFRMSGWRGYQDYLFDHVYLGRSETRGLGANQVVVGDGGFKLYTPLGQSYQWLAALNLKADLPFDVKLLNNIQLFADIGTCAPDGLRSDPDADKILYDAGVSLRLFRGLGEIFVPLLMSENLKDAVEVNNWTFIETVRFSFRFEQLAPQRIIKSISF